MLINGKSPLDKESLIDLLYPKGMTFVFPSGFSPITQFGYGNWEEIADNVSLPIGGTVEVDTGEVHSINGLGLRTNVNGSYSLGTYVNEDGTKRLVCKPNVDGKNQATEVTFTNLYANLSTASNTQTVSIWERKE